MDDHTKKALRRHLQHVARHYVAIPVALEKISELVIYDSGLNVTIDEACLYFRRKQVQDDMRLNHETLLWQSSDYHRTMRLVCTATQFNAEKARYLLNRKPLNANTCNYCFIDESHSPADREQLVIEKDVYGREVGGVHLHKQCAEAWAALRRVVELSELEKSN